MNLNVKTGKGERSPDLREWRDKAELLRLLGHPVRLALLEELSVAPKCVSDIQELLGLRQANVSQHLTLLRRARLVDCHEDGNQRCYYLLRPALARDLLKFVVRDYPVVPKSARQVRRAAGKRRKTSSPIPPEHKPKNSP